MRNKIWGKFHTRKTWTKVFTSLFSKSDRPSKGAQPLVARRNERNVLGLSLVLSLAYFVKERTYKIYPTQKNEGRPMVAPTLLGMLCEEIVSVLFGSAGAKKNIFRFAKSNAESISLVATSDEGFAPSTRANF